MNRKIFWASAHCKIMRRIKMEKKFAWTKAGRNSKVTQPIKALLLAVLSVYFLAAMLVVNAEEAAKTIGRGGGTLLNPPQTSQNSADSSGIDYHGGPVMIGTVNIYFIWYGNWNG